MNEENKILSFYHTQIEPYLQDRVLVICVAIVLLFLLLGVGMLRRRGRPIRVFKTTSGRVQVTRGAIRDLVLGACRHVNAAHRPKVHIKARRGRLAIRIDLRLNEDQRLNDVAVKLQTRIEDVLQDTLSLDRRSVRIDIGLKGIRHNKKTTPPEEEALPVAVAPVPDVAPARAEEDSFVPATSPSEPELDNVAEDTESEPKPKRSFFGWGSRKSTPSDEDEVEDPVDATADDDDPFAPGHVSESDEDREKKA
ncbi:alkaline shock response membrane anchor protein AmaP [Ruficoccus sp. ZRK36]|uniref:alkaline shock response membrane anchor protein AmaP n=1 Tax=Ruficoccus sp. ZRK36 TaxID=2866311 RepID=UPI001C731D7F|nr:alkaline shock response membrane anchor protein AmaP [Ruficoccus sp. ZRK36]QYY36808.1 alkaline shock response membrane anchor protein AmaP [Ruficoccus sp. ZRK36]